MIRRKRLLALFMVLCCLFTMNLSAFAASTPQMVNVAFGAGGTEFTAYHAGSNDTWTTDYWGYDYAVGTTVKASGNTVSDPVFWDPSRVFEGWQLCTLAQVTDNDGNTYTENVPVSGVGLFTTQQAMEYTIPAHDIVFQAQWAGDDADYYNNVWFDGYGGQFTYERCQSNNNWVTETSDHWGNDLKIASSGETFAQQTQGYLRNLQNPVRTGASFEGWLEFKSVEKTDDRGNTYTGFELVSDTLYTTAQVFNRYVPSYDVAYVAKWSTIPTDCYFVDQNVQFDANGGTMNVTMHGQAEGSRDHWGMGCYVGNSPREQGFSIPDPVFWDSSRAFDGWTACQRQMVTDNEGNSWEELVQIPGTSLMTTAQALDYKTPNHTIIFMAQWAGNDDDYNSQVYINGYGARITFDVMARENQWNEESGEVWGQYLKENGQSFETQTQDWVKFKAEPSRPDAAFEGWAEFKVTEEMNSQGEIMEIYELVSDTLYTTAQMLAKPVPSYNVAYVAKWSDIPLNKYFKETSDFPRMTVAGNGGEIFFEVEDANGNVEEGSIEACQYPVEDGQSLKQLLATGMGPELNDMRRPGYKFTGWTLYECENIGVHGVPTGTDPAIGDPDIEVIYMMCSPEGEANGALYDYYAVLEYPTIVDADMSTAELYDFVGSKYYFAKANWEEDDSALRVDMTQGLTTVPSTIINQYPTVADVEDALKDATQAANSSFKDDNMTITYLDVELKIQKEDGTWEVVTYENFPTDGMYILLPYPEGTKGKGFDFVVAHMITGGENAGQVEILEHTETENGLSVKVTSLSPISIAYKESPKSSSGSGSSSSAGRPMVSPGTGDASMTMLFAAAMVSSATVLTGVRRRKNK